MPTSTGDLIAFDATIVNVSSENHTIFGSKLHSLLTIGGVVLDFEFAPALISGMEVGFEMFSKRNNSMILG